MTDSESTIDRVIGQDVLDPDGHRIGTARQVFVDDETRHPEWVTVRTGLLGTRSHLVPLDGARLEKDGLHVPYGKELVEGAPHIDDHGHLTPDQEAELHRHYDVPGTEVGESDDS